MALLNAPPALEDTLPWGWVRVLVVFAGVSLLLYGARRVIDSRSRASRGLGFGQQLAMLGLSLASLLAVVLSLPEMREEILAFLGIVLSAAVALSSTTFLGNAMAGLTLRAVRGFRVGDFIRVDEHFGRVTEQGLVHTEIQTEDRDLTTLPNLYLATHPVKVVRPSGTVLSAQVSLGYDVPRARVEEHLLRAGTDVALEEPFVSILELGDYAVTYRIAGLCTDVPHLISTRSRLRAAMLDRLHEGGVEIVSPAFFHTRGLPRDTAVIPEAVVTAPAAGEPEAVIFDKAEEATTLERLEAELAGLEAEKSEVSAEPAISAEKARLRAQIAELEEKRAAEE